jgi:prefoldin subunit 5
MATNQDNQNGDASAEDGFVPVGQAPAVEPEGDVYEEYEEGDEDADQGSAKEVGEDQTLALASGLDDLQSQALNSVEVAKQLEQLTDVVLSSAEVSTRSASVAADVSHDMRLVMDSVSEDHKRNVMNSRMLLGAMFAFLIIGLGTFFAISTKMQQNIGELDSMSLAVGKRVVDLDATIAAFTHASRSMNELTEKLEDLTKNQEKVEARFDEINKQITAIPTQVSDQSQKNLDAKLQALEKQLQTLDTKIQALANRAPATNAASAAEVQKLKKELEAATSKARDKPELKAEKVETKTAPAPAPTPAVRQEPKPGQKQVNAEKSEAEPLKAEKPVSEAKTQEKSSKSSTPDLRVAKESESKAGADKVNNKASEGKSKEAKSNEAKSSEAKAVETSAKSKEPATQSAKDAFVVYPRPAPVAEN